jgi:hypothetical protein
VVAVSFADGYKVCSGGQWDTGHSCTTDCVIQGFFGSSFCNAGNCDCE